MRLVNFDKMIPYKGVNYENAYTIYESDLDEATVEAIPIEFIEEYIGYQDTEEQKVLRMMWDAWELCEERK